jgi:hypothetical protein
MKRIKLLIVLGMLSLGLGFSSYSLAEGNAQEEINKALLHANFLIKADTLERMHMHMHHILNCMVGEHGKEFDPKVMDPCKGMGNGAINDESSPVKRKLLDQVEKLGSIGVTIENPSAAHDVALAMHALLQEAAK